MRDDADMTPERLTAAASAAKRKAKGHAMRRSVRSATALLRRAQHALLAEGGRDHALCEAINTWLARRDSGRQ